MQGMDREIAAGYGLDLKNIVPYKDTYLIYTDKGRKILKRMMFSSERILFIHGAKEHLVKNGFENVDRYVKTIKDEPCFTFDNANYVMCDFLEGRECNFDNDNEARKAAELLASMHSASKGYKAPGGSKIQDELGRLPAYFNKRLEDIKKLRKLAKKGKSKFDHMFLDNADYFIGLGEQAVTELENSRYGNLVNEARTDGSFCHHDFTHHNIICNEDAFSLINFDYCCFELKIYDLANLIRRKMRKCNWDMDKAILILDGYNSVERLSRDEIAVMKLILQFPQKFWRVVNRYYNSRRSWSERSFIVKLQEVIDEVGGHRKFIDSYNF
ncbi:MAG: CotS family spore coat protein [Ruminiclostridium sp.]|nr:CotS family spore coat protein [Ruminiclostridium sp.]